MKELEKTRRISISAVLFLLVILISLLTFRKPEFSFTKTAANTLETISKQDHLLAFSDFESLDPSTYELIDVRDNYAFSKGHIAEANNIPISQLLQSTRNTPFAKSNKDKLTILYGSNPEQANAAWTLLYQLGYENAKILSISSYYDEREFHINPIVSGKASFDYAQKMKEASTQKVKKIPTKQIVPKKKQVTPKPKKKKKMPEGGC